MQETEPRLRSYTLQVYFSDTDTWRELHMMSTSDENAAIQTAMLLDGSGHEGAYDIRQVDVDEDQWDDV